MGKILKNKNLVMISIVVIFTIVGLYYNINKAECIYVDAYTIKKQTLYKIFNVVGNVDSQSDVYIYSEINSLVKDIYVKEGENIKKGEKICSFKKDKFMQEKIELENYIRKKKKINKLKKGQICSENKYKKERLGKKIYSKKKVLKIKNKQLQKTKVFQKKLEYDNKNRANKQYSLVFQNMHTKIERLQSEIEKLSKDIIKLEKEFMNIEVDAKPDDEELENAEEKLSMLKKQLKCTEIYASTAGTISKLYIEVGKEKVEQKVARISTGSTNTIVAYIPQNKVNDISKGMKVNIINKSEGYKIYTGQIVSVSNIFTKNGIEITISCNDLDNTVQGQKLSLQIIQKECKDVLCIPYDFIIKEGKEQYVMVAKEQEDGKYKVQKVNVQVGFEGDYYVEIRTNELNEGDKVVNPSEYLEINQIVYLNSH